jgi:hypothetical protein
MRFLHLGVLTRSIVVYQGKDLFDVLLYLVDFFNRCFVFDNVFLVFFFALDDFLFQLFLEFLAFIVFSETLISIPVDLLFDLGNLFIKRLIFLSEFIDVFAQSEIPFFGFNKIAN